MKHVKIRPRVLVFCSAEGLPVARAIQTELQHEVYSKIWSQGLFTPAGPSVEDLLRDASEHDFAVAIFTPDDQLHLRGNVYSAPRDNVVWENGMFHGVHGRFQVFAVTPTNAHDLHLPTDLLGTDPIRYDAGLFQTHQQAAVGPTCTKILQAINSSSTDFYARQPRISIWHERAIPTPAQPIHFTSKLRIKVRNENPEPVVLTSEFFAFDQLGAHRDVSGDPHQNRFELAVQDAPGVATGLSKFQRILIPKGAKEIWIGLDDMLDDKAVAAAINTGTCGRWHLTWQRIGATTGFIERYVVRL
jgi:Predicted nucleotide-binding protein containing TIR-like domain